MIGPFKETVFLNLDPHPGACWRILENPISDQSFLGRNVLNLGRNGGWSLIGGDH